MAAARGSWEEEEAAADVSGEEEENILYDLLINTEWPPETEVQPRGNKKHGASFIITRAITGPALFLLQYIWYSPAKFSLPAGLVRLVSKQINWHLVLSSNGKLLAVVQDQCVEIRSAKDDFGSIVGKCQVPRDPNTQWRRVAWSHDCTLLAYAESTGTVRVFDLMGSELFVISPATSFPGDLSYAVAGLIFVEYKASAQWSAELLVINYRGELKSYLVSVGTNQSFQESHSFNFSSHYAHGITTVVYHLRHRLLLVGGCETDEDGVSKATSRGISAWRVLSGSPHYKQVTSYEDDTGTAKRSGLLRIMNFRFYSKKGTEQDGVFKMSLSPDGTLLAAIHFSGKLTMWGIPSLKQQGEWDQSDQPGYDEINPDWRLSSEKRKKIKDKESYYSLMDVNWWAENAVILARCSGALTVSSVKTLKNLLGKSCEWFESCPQVTSAHDGGFLSLECEIKLAPKRLRLESRPGEEDEGEDDSDSDDVTSAKARYFSYLKQGLYFVTEMERFAPPRKRSRTITKNYRLVSLRSTTPEELYQRKIDNEEYGEALSLAQAYGLDSDLVYQRQWRKSTVNIASIQDYLSKIKKRSWVLHECLERVPENVDAAKELLQYGLKGTDLEALIAIGKGEDDGRFILSGEVDIDEIPYEQFLSPGEEAENRKEREARKHQELLLSVNFSKLTLEQKELCRSRLKLLSYLDRLATYEEILGGPHAAEQRYDAEFFKKFRNQNIVLSARTYARESNVRALEILFTYHGSDLLPHRLAILSNFPETTSPHEYSFLLPEACCRRDVLMILPWNEQKHREEDWCENPQCKMIFEPVLQDEDEFLYEAHPELLKYRTTKLSIDLVSDWYWNRAQEIENYAMQVDCALSLVRLGMERKIPGLQVLCDNLVTLEMLIYETGCDLTLTLKDLQEMKDSEKLRLLMMNKFVMFFFCLFRCCLQLIVDCPSAIQDELDLIRALSYLEEFGLTILPLQVRLCSDRLSLIKDCIAQLPTNYKLSAKLLGLADLLRVAGDDQTERKGQVLILLVEQALHFQDYKAASMHCQELIATGYSKSWEVCSQLGQSEGYHDLRTRQELMAFALTHCPPGAIESLLAANSSLQTQILYQAVNYQLRPSEGEENINITGPSSLIAKETPQEEISIPSSQSADLLYWTTAKTMKVLSNTTTTTKAMLHAVSDGQWWKRSLTYLRPLHGQEFEDVLKSSSGTNAAAEKQSCHPFYESLIADSYVTESEVAYTGFQHNSSESFAEVLLRTGKLAETKSEGEDLFPATEVLLQLASDALPNDMTLSLAYLLALPQVVDANKCFEKQSHSALSLQLASYYYSLQIYAHLAPCFKDKCHPLYRADPKELIKMVTKHVSQCGYADWPEEIATLIKQLYYYNERLLDFTQAQILQGLGKGVDVQRFTADGQYKRETILGLAETLEENVYNIALSLAQRYSVPLWEVYMTHLEFLFTDSGLSAGEIEDRAQSLGLFETLKTNPEALHEHMAKYVYPGIEGTDHKQLLYYFTLLENCGCSEFVKHAIKPETHIRLLKKFKAVAPDLNYKKLTDENVSPLGVLQPILTSQNILSISKLAPKIPEKDGSILSPSSVYTIWLQKLFWNGDSKLIKKAPETIPEWLSAYDTCAKYFDRLYPGDIVTFIDDITFSSKAVTKLSVDARLEMTNKAIKAMQQIIEKSRKKNSEDGMDSAGSTLVTYEKALNHLQQSLAHLETLNHRFITCLKNSDQEMLQKYGHLYDLSRSEKEKIHDQAVAMCIDGQPLDMIQQLLEVAVGDLELSPREIVQCAINQIVFALSGNGAEFTSIKDPLQILEEIVSAVHASAEKGENLVSSDDLLEWLRPFCSDDSLPVKPRIKVLQIMEQAFHLSDEDSRLLVFFRTQAVLKACWPETKVEIIDIENEEKRYSLFLELLHSSNSQSEFQHLVLLLQAWPPMKSASIFFLDIGDIDDSSCDSEILSLLLNAKLVVKCISTMFYPHLINHLLANQEEGRWDIEEIAKELQEAGFSAEAGSLMMCYKGTHPALRTYSTALSAIQHWI
ncbi:NBAS subunit of NRZ tethering complex [Gopherus flavomarginatus]|uniref:NBAS subunit of NRZ tethering complex n=1 Tax=Gopherus flavomarginatus TaxID=286002 RepID=UPI0021CC182F|nr:NBAS subunit of NRZ tethering complex [Gopherus flavomarginatus]